eukprot:4255643-Pyramimonas_sp.AAC.1
MRPGPRALRGHLGGCCAADPARDARCPRRPGGGPDLRRGRAKDLQELGATLAEILAAGEW